MWPFSLRLSEQPHQRKLFIIVGLTMKKWAEALILKNRKNQEKKNTNYKREDNFHGLVFPFEKFLQLPVNYILHRLTLF